MESPPKAVENSTIVKETEKVATTHQFPRSGRQNKCLSAAATNPLTKKRFLQTHAGLPICLSAH